MSVPLSMFRRQPWLAPLNHTQQVAILLPGEAVRHIFGKSHNLEKTLNVIKMFDGIAPLLGALASNDSWKSPPRRNDTRAQMLEFNRRGTA